MQGLLSTISRSSKISGGTVYFNRCQGMGKLYKSKAVGNNCLPLSSYQNSELLKKPVLVSTRTGQFYIRKNFLLFLYYQPGFCPKLGLIEVTLNG
jgi:hypothetical protein